MNYWSAARFASRSPFEVSPPRAAVDARQAAAPPSRAERHRRTRPGTLRDRAWLASVDLLDGVLRWHYGVHEYTDDPDCLFRVALAQADRPFFLADGTFVDRGADVCCLHFWNGHVPRFPATGPDLGWANTMRWKIRHSLRQLCLHVEREPAWERVAVVRADASLPFRPLAHRQLQRLARRHGFQTATCGEAERGRIWALAENMLLWGFVRAYNPGALTRHNLRQGRQALLLSRQSLLAHYGTPSRRSAGRPQGPTG